MLFVKYTKIVAISTLIFVTPTILADDYWESSPYNWKNSANNWDNSSNNWANSPNNWKNSPNNYDSDTVIRDKNGKATGYAVPKSDGGVNYYNLDGSRNGYR